MMKPKHNTEMIHIHKVCQITGMSYKGARAKYTFDEKGMVDIDALRECN